MKVWQRFSLFYFLTFLLLALVPLLALVMNDGSMDFDAAAALATQATGIPWTSNLWNVLRLALVEPVLWLVVLGSAVPTLAAIVVLLTMRQTNAGQPLLMRLHPTGGDKATLQALGTYLLIPVILVPVLALVFVLRNITGGDYGSGVNLLTPAIVPALLAAAFLDQGALLEEFGWRGFATHEFQAAKIRPLRAALIMGLTWGLWHLPRDLTTGVVERLGVPTYIFLYLPSFVGGTVAVSIIASYFMNRLSGSILPAIIVHGITNDSVGISGAASIVEALTPYHQITKTLPLALVALALVLLTRGQLAYKPPIDTEESQSPASSP